MTIGELLKYYREERVYIWLNGGEQLSYQINIFQDFDEVIPAEILDKKVCTFGTKDEFCINIWEY